MKNCRIKYIVCLLIGIVMLETGCKKDWFDVKSDITLTVPATLQDFEYLLDDFLVMNQKTPCLAEVGSDGHYGTESFINYGNNVPLEFSAYIWTKSSSPLLNVEDWNGSYQKIFQCNLVLDGLKKLNPEQEKTRYNAIKGNALFHKAKSYFDLAQIYAQPYQAATASNDMGIPLKDGIDVTEPAKRASVKQTYDQILADLHTAASLLPNLPESKTRGGKAAAFALLARTYLIMGDYANAGINAEASLQLYNKLIDLNTIPASNADMGMFNLETIFYAERGTGGFSTWLTGFYTVDPLLYSLYDNDDLRKTRFFSFSGTDIIFKGNYTYYGVGFNGLATDEQYLIRAECYARAGNVTAAMKDLNDLLKTRWNNAVTYPIRTAADAEDALKQVLLERRKELLHRNLRWTDLRRLNLDPRFRVTLTRIVKGQTYTLEPNSYKYTLPIPDDVLNLGPQMKQTPGWE